MENPTVKSKKSKKKKKWVKAVIILLVIAAGLAGTVLYFKKKNEEKASTENAVSEKNISKVMRGGFSNQLTSSGSLSAKDSYTVSSLVEGEVLKADFEEGDQVTEGQVLYVIDSTDMQSSIQTAEKNLATAQQDLQDAKEDLETAKAKFNEGTYTSKSAGYIKSLSLNPGDTVNANGQIGELYNDTSMKLRVPFLSTEADMIGVGSNLAVVLSDTGEEIPGRVTEKSSMNETMSGGTIVKYVTLAVNNPGGLSTSDTATAYTGELVSAGSGTFEASIQNKLSVDLPASVKVDRVLVHNGQYVSEGTPLFTITSESLENALKSYNKAVTSAENQVENCQDKLDLLKEELEDYTITAPISGQVIQKNVKAGETISKSGNSSSTSLATIYDLSELTFEMSIDELDIMNVTSGQEVKVEADAFSGKKFTGHVSKVSLVGSYSNGVTTFPVTVTLDDKGSLIPSMNVDGTIILEEVKDVLYIPSSALQRGDIVYVKNTSLTGEENTASSGGTGNKEGRTGASGENGPETPSGAPSGGALPQDGNEPTGKENSEPKDGAQQQGSPAGGSDKGSGSEKGSGSKSGKGSENGSENPPQMSGSGMPGMEIVEKSNAPEGFTAVRVVTGLVSEDYVEICSGLSEGQEIYVNDEDAAMGFGFFGMGGMGGGPGGSMGGGPGGGGPGGGRGGF